MNPITLLVQLLGLLAGPEAGMPSRIGPAADRTPEAAAATLREDLAAILRQAGLDARTGVLVLSLDRRDTLFAHNAGSPLAPASNLKLLTSFGALHYLGATFRYNTYLLAAGPVRDGVLEGDLVLYGTGDPTLSERFGARVLDAFADTLLALGIREIRGAVVGDASYFEGSGIATGWQDAYSNARYAAPSSALSFSENIAVVEIRPAPGGGQPVVRISPGGDGLEIVNRVRTVAQGRTRVSVSRSGFDSPITVSGQVSRTARTVQYPVPVADPALFAAGALREAMEERGIVVQGGTRSARSSGASPLAGRSLFAPALATARPLGVLAIHTSPPLLDVLEVVNKRSNNFMAEQVLRTMGRVVGGDGTVEGGTGVLLRFAADVLSVDTSMIQLFDGSGLSPLNRMSAAVFVRLLEHAAASRASEPFFHTLPQTGARDGLRRMLGTPAEGRVWAKTGTIRMVSGLSGYVRTADGEMLVFSILNNAAAVTARAKGVEDRIVVRLAGFERSAAGESGVDTQAARLP